MEISAPYTDSIKKAQHGNHSMKFHGMEISAPYANSMEISAFYADSMAYVINKSFGGFHGNYCRKSSEKLEFHKILFTQVSVRVKVIS